MKKFYRSKTDRVFGGVCAGIAEYFNIDPSIVRILTLVLGFTWGSGVLAYLIAWAVIPKEGEE